MIPAIPVQFVAQFVLAAGVFFAGVGASLQGFGASLQVIAQPAAAAVISALWQGALIACGLTLCLRLAPRMPAAHRFAAWAAGFAMIVGLPLLGLATGWTVGTAGGVAIEAQNAAAKPWLSLDARWSLAIAGLWAAVTLARVVELLVHSAKVRRLWKAARPAEVDGGLRAMLAARAASWRCGQVEICASEALERPCVIGFWRPRILIPEWLLKKMTPGELEQIVLHEAEHLRRWDDWTNLLQKVCLAVFPLNPALAWIERRLCREREMACDDGVVEVTRAPRAYAACLASLAERRLERRAEALSLGAWQRRPELVERVHSLLRRKSGVSTKAGRVVLGAIGCGLLIGVVELARCPQLVGFVQVRPAETAQVAGTVEAVQAAGVVEGASMGIVRKAQGGKTIAIKQRPWMEEAAVETPAVMTVGASKAAMATAQTAAQPMQQWVVLTAYEEIESADGKTQLQADYETDSGADATGAVTARPSVQPANGITVTQLILKIVPASAQGKPDMNSHTGQPKIAAIHDGWLVIQL